MKHISAGSVALKQSGRSLKQIARETGCSYSQAGLWSSGHRKPPDTWRAKLKKHYGIASEAWDEAPPTAGGLLARLGAPPSEPPQAPPAPGLPTTVRGAAESMIKQIRELQEKAATDPLLTPDERGKTLARAATILTSVARLTGEAGDIPEAKILRTPAWGRIRDAMLVALTPWPDALRAVGEAVARLES